MVCLVVLGQACINAMYTDFFCHKPGVALLVFLLV